MEEQANIVIMENNILFTNFLMKMCTIKLWFHHQDSQFHHDGCTKLHECWKKVCRLSRYCMEK